MMYTIKNLPDNVDAFDRYPDDPFKVWHNPKQKLVIKIRKI